MNHMGSIVLILLALTWGTPRGAVAAKVEHFKDGQGTVHITNVKPEGQAVPEAAPAAPAPVKFGEQSAEAAGPEAAPEPEPPQTEASPDVEEPDNG
jgi:hypothetical protein